VVSVKYEQNLYKVVNCIVRFEVFTAVTMKSGVFWDVTPYGSCKNHISEERSPSFRLCRLLVTAGVPS
jgi:hypothetical protein